jgi:hypothetical protein
MNYKVYRMTNEREKSILARNNMKTGELTKHSTVAGRLLQTLTTPSKNQFSGVNISLTGYQFVAVTASYAVTENIKITSCF